MVYVLCVHPQLKDFFIVKVDGNINFEDTKEVIRIRKSKDRQRNCIKKRNNATNNDREN
jgi:hypothetical protein